MKNNGYSIFKSNGSWFVRWSEYRDGKRIQPSHKLCSVQDYPKESEVKPLAAEHMARVRKTQTIEAGTSVKEFVEKVFFPRIETRLAKATIELYRQQWKRMAPHFANLEHQRLRDIQTSDAQTVLDNIHAERSDSVGHGVYVQCKATIAVIFGHAIRMGHHPGPNPESEVMATAGTARMALTHWKSASSSLICFLQDRKPLRSALTPSWVYASQRPSRYCPTITIG